MNERIPSGAPIAKSVIARLKRRNHGKPAHLLEAIVGPSKAWELESTVITEKELAKYHPAHAAYINAQQHMSVFSEQLTGLKDMAPFVEIISRAEDLYMPGGPPMSPLTTSYFTCWCFFDACVGKAHETIGTVTLEAGAAFGMDTELWRIIRLMQNSCMALYIHKGTEQGLAILEELLTGVVFRAIVPAGYLGQKGELWYVRLLDPPFPDNSIRIVFTTPYIVVKPGISEWKAYIQRTLTKESLVADYAYHMKYGPTREYWNDYILEAYVNHRREAIYLAGLPDVAESRPHSEMNNWGY